MHEWWWTETGQGRNRDGPHTLAGTLVVVDIGPHQGGRERVGSSGTDAKVEIGAVGPPEEALVVEAAKLGIEDGFVLLSSNGAACEQQLRHDAGGYGQQAKVRHRVEEGGMVVVDVDVCHETMSMDGRRVCTALDVQLFFFEAWVRCRTLRVRTPVQADAGSPHRPHHRTGTPAVTPVPVPDTRHFVLALWYYCK